MAVLRYLDIVLVAVGAIPAVALGAPSFGYAIGGGVWVLQRIIAATDRRLVSKATTSEQKQLAFNLFERFGRIWLLAGGIVIAGIAGDRADGLTAALVIFGAYSIRFVITLMSGQPPPRSAP